MCMRYNTKKRMNVMIANIQLAYTFSIDCLHTLHLILLLPGITPKYTRYTPLPPPPEMAKMYALLVLLIVGGRIGEVCSSKCGIYEITFNIPLMCVACRSQTNTAAKCLSAIRGIFSDLVIPRFSCVPYIKIARY